MSSLHCPSFHRTFPCTNSLHPLSSCISLCISVLLRLSCPYTWLCSFYHPLLTFCTPSCNSFSPCLSYLRTFSCTLRLSCTFLYSWSLRNPSSSCILPCRSCPLLSSLHNHPCRPCRSPSSL